MFGHKFQFSAPAKPVADSDLGALTPKTLSFSRLTVMLRKPVQPVIFSDEAKHSEQFG
jgi:hypothetical protein